MKALLFDIEGTTTDIKFVHEVLFPYARENMQSFLENTTSSDVTEILETIKNKNNVNSREEVLELLLRWIQEDKKITELKDLQGLLWESGYINGDYKAHLYPEVINCFKKWSDNNFKIYIYSSGSVKAQKLLFKYSVQGDLTPLISGYFDTNIGAKREVQSYQNILDELKLAASEVTFFSDIEEELDAAAEIGIKTLHLNRDGLYNESRHKIINSFNEVHFHA